MTTTKATSGLESIKERNLWNPCAETIHFEYKGLNADERMWYDFMKLLFLYFDGLSYLLLLVSSGVLIAGIYR